MGHHGGHAVEGVPARPREELNNLAKNIADCTGEPTAHPILRPRGKIPIVNELPDTSKSSLQQQSLYLALPRNT